MIFEGTEKKFELVISSEHPSFRSFISRAEWNHIVTLSKASILSSIHNKECDTYLLSESSLFVFDHKVIMITCGKTVLTQALSYLLKKIPLSQVESMFYERKNEIFPELQPTLFWDDVKILEKIIPGKTKIFGDPKHHHISLFYLEKPQYELKQDQTLEVLMYDIDKNVKHLFHSDYMKSPMDIQKLTGLNTFLNTYLPQPFLTDDFLFQPSGYSINAIQDHFYYTFHVTPNDIGSYVSFETNLTLTDPQQIEQLTQKMVLFFQPKRFDLLYFNDSHHVQTHIKNYSQEYMEHVELNCGYNVQFLHFSQKIQSISQSKHLKLLSEERALSSN